MKVKTKVLMLDKELKDNKNKYSPFIQPLSPSFSSREWLHFSPTNKSVIKSGLMKKIIEKQINNKYTTGSLQTRKIAITKIKNKEECNEFINELRNSSNKFI